MNLNDIQATENLNITKATTAFRSTTMTCCVADGCNKRCSFNDLGESQPLYCGEHKQKGMINVLSRVCCYPECRSYPFYNILGEKNGIYCSKHKEDDMVDVKNRTCVVEDCLEAPTFNFGGEKRGIYCSQHKDPEMVDVRQSICQHESCNRKYPLYNMPGESKGMYCNLHYLPGMVAVKKRKTKRCKYPGCDTYPSYNFPGKRTEHYCAVHKAPTMVEVKRRCCERQGCQVRPSFNFPGMRKRRFCQAHMLDGMVHAVHAYNKDKTLKEGVATRTTGRKRSAASLEGEVSASTTSRDSLGSETVSFEPLLVASKMIENGGGIVSSLEMLHGLPSAWAPKPANPAAVEAATLPESRSQAKVYTTVISYDEMS
jgi:hypothetical protein